MASDQPKKSPKIYLIKCQNYHDCWYICKYPDINKLLVSWYTTKIVSFSPISKLEEWIYSYNGPLYPNCCYIKVLMYVPRRDHLK